jgi:hypothetical protein
MKKPKTKRKTTRKPAKAKAKISNLATPDSCIIYQGEVYVIKEIDKTDFSQFRLISVKAIRFNPIS